MQTLNVLLPWSFFTQYSFSLKGTQPPRFPWYFLLFNFCYAFKDHPTASQYPISSLCVSVKNKDPRIPQSDHFVLTTTDFVPSDETSSRGGGHNMVPWTLLWSTLKENFQVLPSCHSNICRGATLLPCSRFLLSVTWK